MPQPVYLMRQDVIEAENLMAQHGREAGLEAAERAEHSRNQGNHINFCRWRQIERLIQMMHSTEVDGTRH